MADAEENERRSQATNGDSGDQGVRDTIQLLQDGDSSDESTDSLDDHANRVPQGHDWDAPARDHPYLPGTSHPLVPDSFLRRRRQRSGSSRQSQEETTKRFRNNGLDDDNGGSESTNERDDLVENSWMLPKNAENRSEACHQITCSLVELAILELPGVVLFPASTIPIRLRNREWLDYLGPKIDAARGVGGLMGPDEEVRIGILTLTPPVREQTRRQSWTRAAIRSRTGSRMVMFWREYDQLLRESQQDPTQREDDHESEMEESAADRTGRLQRSREQRTGDPLIGRIGTMASVTFTHEDAAGVAVNAHHAGSTEESLVWQRREREQIIVTALGTSRFRIISCIRGNEADQASLSSGFGGESSRVRVYIVEEIPEIELQLPTLLPKSINASVAKNDSQYLYHHEKIVQALSFVSSVPQFALKNWWPWRLVGLTVQALGRIPEFEGLKEALPSLPGNLEDDGADCGQLDSSMLDPVQFSFWMASNMPFSEKEKLQLLEMSCAMERLKFIYDKVLEREQRKTFICCRSCSQPLSQTSSVFSVGGAEGTTGAYVNRYGIVHQTVTVRQLSDSGAVFCEGRPSTQDSWFPGYAYEIAYCSLCQSHLGWKFILVGRRQDSTQPHGETNCPQTFWGLSGSSITTKIESTSSIRL